MATWIDYPVEPRLLTSTVSMTDWEAVIGQYVGIVQRRSTASSAIMQTRGTVSKRRFWRP